MVLKRKPAVKRQYVRRQRKRNYSDGSGAYRIPTQYRPYIRAGIKNIAGYTGKAIANYVGAPGFIGEKMGRKVGSAISRMIGSGAYVTNDVAHKVNSLFQAQPEYAKLNLGPEDIVVEHREYVRDVYSSSTAGAYKVEQITINPGLSQSFPWLSGIAMNYESYQMLGCVYEYKSQYSDSTVAGAGTSGTLGEVMMYVDYSVDSATTPSSKFAMENSFGSISARVNDCILCGVECMPKYNLQANLLVANPSVFPSNVNQYHLGILNVASQGIQAANVQIGSIYCHSRVVLRKPKTATALGDVSNFAHYTSVDANSINRWGVNQTRRAGNMNITFTAQTLVFPAEITEGLYKISCNSNGTNTGLAAVAPFATLTNCSLRPLYATGNGYSSSPNSAVTTTTSFQQEWYIDINGPSATIAINNGICSQGIINPTTDIFIQQESLTYQV